MARTHEGPVMTERRRDPRYRISSPVRLWLAAGQAFVDGRITDISCRGIRIAISHSIPSDLVEAGETCTFDFTMQAGEVVSRTAVVRHRTSREIGFEVSEELPLLSIFWPASIPGVACQEPNGDFDSDGRAPRRNRTLLVIEDEAAVRALVGDYFEALGYAVVRAGSGEEGLAAAARTRPNVVLLDIRMPGMDGVETLKRLREQDASMGVVMMTAVADVDLARETLRVGAVAYVTKPFDLEYLGRIVRAGGTAHGAAVVA